MSTKKFLLEEKDIPTAWYNIVADMKNKPLPILNPQTKQPLKEEDLYPLFSKGVSHLEMNSTDTVGSCHWIGKSAGYARSYLFQERECKPDRFT